MNHIMKNPSGYRNIVLIGMSGAGKTVVGRYVAEMLAMNFIDSDHMIIARTGKSIDCIFREKGEEYFRNLEKEMIKSISVAKGAVISTGGGVVLDKQNIERLKEHGLIFFLKASIGVLVSNLKLTLKNEMNRPLIQGDGSIKRKIEKLYDKRKDLYLLNAQRIIDVDGKSIEKIGEEVIFIYKDLCYCSNDK